MKLVLSGILILIAMTVKAQELNKTIEDQTKHKQIMLNSCTREAVMNFPEFKEMYDAVYPSYQPDSSALADLKKLMTGKKVTIVMGTWCGDSKLQVPHFYRILDAIKFPEKDAQIICVDGNKKAENGLIDGLNIDRVPTFIISDKKGKEIGRIVEQPKATLEHDLRTLLEEK